MEKDDEEEEEGKDDKGEEDRGTKLVGNGRRSLSKKKT